jgi:hypothetical protein
MISVPNWIYYLHEFVQIFLIVYLFFSHWKLILSCFKFRKIADEWGLPVSDLVAMCRALSSCRGWLPPAMRTPVQMPPGFDSASVRSHALGHGSEAACAVTTVRARHASSSRLHR